MAMEVVCGNCQGRLLVEQTGVIVACPHCGAHLQIGDPTPTAATTSSSEPPPSFSSAPPPVQPAPSAPPEPAAPSFAPQFTSPSPINLPPGNSGSGNSGSGTSALGNSGPATPAPANPFAANPFTDNSATEKSAPENSSTANPFTTNPFTNTPAPSTPASVNPFTSAPPEPVATPRQPAILPETSVADELPEIILTAPPEVLRQASAAAADTQPQLDEITAQYQPPKSAEISAGDNDTWMPKIDLALPPKEPEVKPAPDLSETSTLMMPPPSFGAHPAAPPIPSAATAAAMATTFPRREEPTGIWSRSQLEESSFETPTMVMPGGVAAESPMFGGFAPGGPADTSTAATVIVPDAFASTPQPPSPTAEANESLPRFEAPESSRDAVVPRYLFLIVASYASAITLAFLYLWWRGAGGTTLDLPDVVPEFKNNKFGLTLIKEDPLPLPYRLKLGETKRYGNIEITPLKVTRGPLEFTYFNNNGTTKPPTQTPVLKLWVKFENVSDDQTFPALDEKLLFPRVHDKENVTQDRSNNYVCQQSQRQRVGKRVPVYSLLINGDWLLKDQNLNTPIGPHKTWETYIPTNDEDLSALEGPLAWRLHFRKGYNRSSFRGVTTLVEVEFDSKDIRSES